MRETIPAVFARGGTSKALIFHKTDLPDLRDDWVRIFLRAMGSPDPTGRQLDGMGGGLSSLSKVCVVGQSTHPDADVDYTFAQVQIRNAVVDFSGNCGNMAAAIGPFAIEEGLVDVPDGTVQLRIHNTNTSKLVHATFDVREGEAIEQGELQIPGVPGSGAPIRLDFIDPGGATTGRVLPTGAVVDELHTSWGPVRASLVDAGNACVFVLAEDVGASGLESPDELEASGLLKARLAELRELGAIEMGITRTREEARESMLVPLVALVAPPGEFQTMDGEYVSADQSDVAIRMISNGQAHRAIPMTGSLCVAVAERLAGTLVSEVSKRRDDVLRIGMPSGVLSVNSDVEVVFGLPHVAAATIYRTSRRLLFGRVSVGP